MGVSCDVDRLAGTGSRAVHVRPRSVLRFRTMAPRFSGEVDERYRISARRRALRQRHRATGKREQDRTPRYGQLPGQRIIEPATGVRIMFVILDTTSPSLSPGVAASLRHSALVAKLRQFDSRAARLSKATM